jgi:hypothetical protein
VTTTLGIHVASATIAAALAEGDPPTTRELMLGTAGPTTAAAVAAGADGAVLVGDAARDAGGPVVTDPLLRGSRGRTGALTAVITHVVGRATATAGSAPARLAIVVPDDFAAVERDNIVAAANAAGFTDVNLVPESLAVARGQGSDGTRHAVGAALVGSFDAPPPLVTAEELGQMAVPDEPAVAPPTPEGSASVFDEPVEPEVPPVRATPEPVAAPPAQPRPAAPAAAPAGMVAPPPLQPIPERKVPTALIVGVVGMALVALLALVLTRSGDTETSTPATTTTTVEPAETTTTAADTTTTEPAATTSSSTSTTSTTSTSTSSTSTTTTTTTPVRVASPGPVTLGETGLAFDTGALVQFGQGDGVVLATIAQVLGDPDSDSGPTENDFCVGPSARFVRYGNLELVFTSPGDDPEDPLVFSQWYADGHTDPTGLVTPEGLGESSTVGFLEVTFPGAFVLIPPFEDDIVGIFAITNPQTGGVLNGTTLGLDPEGVVTSLWAGDSCTRVFT